MKDSTTHYMATVKIGPKGQIVIPKEIRDMFGMEPGESLIIMADSSRGVMLHKQSVMEGIAKAIFAGGGEDIYLREEQAHLPGFARAIEKTIEKGSDKV